MIPPLLAAISLFGLLDPPGPADLGGNPLELRLGEPAPAPAPALAVVAYSERAASMLARNFAAVAVFEAEPEPEPPAMLCRPSILATCDLDEFTECAPGWLSRCDRCSS